LPNRQPLVERAEILLERRSGDLARAPRIFVAKHVKRDHHLAVAGMAGLAPRLAVKIDERPDRADRDRHQRIAFAAGELEGFRRLRGGDIEFWARSLRRPRQRGHLLEGMEAPVVRGIFLCQQQLDLLEAFTETRLRFIRRDAEAPEFVRQKGAGKSDVEPPAGNAVEHSDFARELERVVEHRQHRAGDEAHRLRALRRGGEKDDRIGAIAAVTGEVVLDGADVPEAQCLRFFGDRKRFGVVFGGALVGMIDGGKKLYAELHEGRPWLRASSFIAMAESRALEGNQSIQAPGPANAVRRRLTA
jgi:hypothetical protein